MQLVATVMSYNLQSVQVFLKHLRSLTPVPVARNKPKDS